MAQANCGPTTAIPHRFSPSPSAVVAHLLYFTQTMSINFSLWMYDGGAKNEMKVKKKKLCFFGLNKIYFFNRASVGFEGREKMLSDKRLRKTDSFFMGR